MDGTISFDEILRIMKDGSPLEKEQFNAACESYMTLMAGVVKLRGEMAREVGFRGDELSLTQFHRFHIEVTPEAVVFCDGPYDESADVQANVLAEFAISSDGEAVVSGRWFPKGASTEYALNLARTYCMASENIEEARKYTNGGHFAIRCMEWPDDGGIVARVKEQNRARIVAAFTSAGIGARVVSDVREFDRIYEQAVEMANPPVSGYWYWDGERVVPSRELDSPYVSGTVEDRALAWRNACRLRDLCVSVEDGLRKSAGVADGDPLAYGESSRFVPTQQPMCFAVCEGAEARLAVKCVGDGFVWVSGESDVNTGKDLSVVEAMVKQLCLSDENLQKVRNEVDRSNGRTIA